MAQRRDQRGLPGSEDLLRDVRFGARMLRHTPLLTAVALLTLTLAIGASGAVFSVVDPLLFRDLPVRDPASLVEFTFQFPRDPPLNMFSLANYALYRNQSHVFSDMFGLTSLATAPRDGEDAIDADVVTGNFFQALGVQPALGRPLTALDDAQAAAPAAVVSWHYWKTQLNGSAHVLGSPITIHDTRIPEPIQATIVGVAPEGFSGIVVGYNPDAWVSLSAVPARMRSNVQLALVARLKPGASIADARAEMRVLDRARIEERSLRDPQWRHVTIDVRSARAGLDTPLRQQFRRPLLLLIVIVAGVLLLACVNIGTLLLARGAARQHEMAVRVSLGAGRARIARQVLTESLLLAAFGGLLGLGASRVGAATLMRVMMSGTRAPGPAPHLNVALDARVLAFTAAITVFAALLFGLMPAVAAFVSAPAATLRRTGGGHGSRRAFANTLVVTQVAMSLALLSVSCLSITYLHDLRDRSLGFNREGVLLVSVNTSRARNRAELVTLYDRLVRSLRAIPGVRVVAASGTTPMAPGAASRFLRGEGFDEPAEERHRVALNWISANYFATFGTPLLAGRDFRDRDTNEARHVIVNETLARRYFAGRNPLGGRVWLENESDPYEIVGVVGDVKWKDIKLAPPPTAYLFGPMAARTTTLSLRTDVNPTAVAADARRDVDRVLGPDAVRQVTTLAEQVDAVVVPERLMALLGGFFSGVGALLAAIGLYALVAYTVARRTKEIGIRMALGATRHDVTRMMLRIGLAVVASGFLVGLPLAFWGARLTATAVEGLPGGGVAPAGTAAAAMLVIAALAVFVPVRRATRIDPVAALRSD